MPSLLFFSLLLVALEAHLFIHPKNSINVRGIPQPHEVPSSHFVNSPQVSVTPTLLKTSGSSVTVSWSGINSPSSDDWIGVYSPANVDRSLTAPLKYQWANASSTHLTTGSGSLTFILVNGRADYSFTVFQNGLDSPVPVGTSNVVEFENYNEPLQARLSLTTKQDEMRLMWSTLDAVKPQVRWGKESGKYENSSMAISTTYYVTDLCGEPGTTVGWRDPGLLHTAVMSNLERDQLYYYVFGDDAYGWSQEASFYSPIGQEADRYVRFYAFGDLGQAPPDGAISTRDQPPALNVVKLINEDLNKNKETTRLVAHIGDISYATGYLCEWDDFGVEIEPISSQIPWQASPGNHESDWAHTDTIYTGTDSGGECGVPFYLRFPIPSQTPEMLPSSSPSFSRSLSSSPSVHWYSIDHGPVHLVFMSTEHDYTTGSDQYNFILSDLASVDKTKTPWIIFTGHRPMYVDSKADGGNGSDTQVSLLLREHIEPLLYKYQVDVGFWGHHHSFQQTCFVYNTTCLETLPLLEEQDLQIEEKIKQTGKASTIIRKSASSYIAPVHFVIGMAGQTLSTNIKPEQPDYSKYVNDIDYGYALVEMGGGKYFQLSFITQYDQLIYQFFLIK